MSQMASFVDAAEWIDEMNVHNVFINYYIYWMVIAVGMDILLRNQFIDVTLDDYMRKIWQNYGKKEIQTNLSLDLPLRITIE